MEVASYRETEDRSFVAFVSAIVHYPGFKARVAAAACFCAAGLHETGIEDIALGGLGTAAIALAIGYPIWRKTGTRR